ncbi:MAG: hypothetical protein ACREBD_25975 [Blastocatellia bacterium]
MNLGYLFRCGDPHWALILISVLIYEANFTVKRINFHRQLSAQSSVGFLAVKRNSINVARPIVIQFATAWAVSPRVSQ